MKKYKLIINNLISEFETGAIMPGDKLPTEQQLMNTYKVSRITVRAALEELTKRGLISRTAGKGTFYIGDNTSAENKKMIIAVIILHTGNELMKIIEGIEDVVKDCDTKVSTYFSNESAERERSLCEKAMEDGADGIIIFPTDESSNSRFYSDLIYNKFPIVFIDRSPVNNCNKIQSNNEFGMFKMTEYVIENGHTQIAYITPFSLSVLMERFTGFVSAMNRHGLKVGSENIIKLDRVPASISEDPEFIYNAVDELIKRPNPPTAIMCSNDIIALHVITKLKKLGEPYSSISVSGFDNANYSSKNAYSITTVEQNFFEIGKKASKLMFEILNGQKDYLTSIKTPIRLIYRDSVKNIK